MTVMGRFIKSRSFRTFDGAPKAESPDNGPQSDPPQGFTNPAEE